MIETLAIYLLVILIIAYIFLIISYYVGWRRIQIVSISEHQTDITTFSIIIPYRNEASNLPSLLRDLQALEYPASWLEILLVDDESEDNSFELVRDFIAQHQLPWTSIQTKGGKKKAIYYALQKAQNEYILSLDADCQFRPNLLTTYRYAVQKQGGSMIAGPVAFSSNNTFWGHFLALEFLSLVVSGAGAIGLNQPIMLNAANLLYKRLDALDFYQQADLNLQSGDDIFLMHFIQKKHGNQAITFLKHPEAIVLTPAPPTFQKWIQQRLRWTSKAKHYQWNNTSRVAILILLFNMSILSLLLCSAFSNYCFQLWLIAISTKVLIDLPLLISGALFFDKKASLKYFLFLEILYPFYIVFVGIFGLFSKPLWKGRKY
jgi:cellulose synthase/poly-beta-1,6-N-acetylglucosamine synthase-like glycosyltransferase